MIITIIQKKKRKGKERKENNGSVICFLIGRVH